MTKPTHKTDTELRNLILTDELWGVYYEHIGESGREISRVRCIYTTYPVSPAVQLAVVHIDWSIETMTPRAGTTRRVMQTTVAENEADKTQCC